MDLNMFLMTEMSNKWMKKLVIEIHTYCNIPLISSISDTEEYEKSVKKDPYACVQQDVELRSHKVWGRVMFKNISLEVFCLWLAMTNTGFYHLKSSNSALEVAG